MVALEGNPQSTLWGNLSLRIFPPTFLRTLTSYVLHLPSRVKSRTAGRGRRPMGQPMYSLASTCYNLASARWPTLNTFRTNTVDVRKRTSTVYVKRKTLALTNSVCILWKSLCWIKLIFYVPETHIMYFIWRC